MVFLTDVVLFLETGTAVTFFFTRNTDLFFGVAVLATRRDLGGERRRVLTFPSGFLGEVDLELLGSLDLCLGLGFAVLVGRGEDAEGDGDAGLKVQVDDFSWHERIFSYNPSRIYNTKGRTRKILWLLSRGKQKSGKEVEKEED